MSEIIVNRSFSPFIAWIKLNVSFMITKFSIPAKLSKGLKA